MGNRARGRGALGAVLIALIAGALILPASAAAAPTPLTSIGSTGSGAGQLSAPRGVAIDGSGNLYVAEAGNDRISVFAPTGAFIHAFGGDVALPDGGSAFEVCTAVTGCQAGFQGSGAGQLNNSQGVTVDGSGNLYVAEGSNRISVFNTAGPTFTRGFGFDVVPPDDDFGFEVCTNATGCIFDEPTDLGSAGELTTPTDIALDGAGNLYVAEFTSHRISVFNPAVPSFTRAFGRDVAEPDTNPVFEVCPTQGACRTGDVTTTSTGFNGPRGLELDGSGNLFVSDDNDRINVINAAVPSFARAFGWDVAEPDASNAFEVCPAQGACRIGDPGGLGGQLNEPPGLVFDGSGGLNVVDRANHRISVFNAAAPSFTQAFGWDVAEPDASNAFELCPTQGTCRAGDSGAGAGQLNLPEHITADCRGAVWVSDAGNNRIQRFGEPGTPLPPCPAAAGPAAGPSVPSTPSNAFTIGGLKGKTLSVTVPVPGTVEVKDAGAEATGVRAMAAAKRLLNPSSALGGPGTIKVVLSLTKAAKKTLRQKGKVRVRPAVTFTPTGGTANTQSASLKVKKKKRK